MKLSLLHTKETGFTIIEVVIVMSIFLFIIGVVITMFISVVETQRSVLQQQRVLNQMSYVEEYMSKALRMARLDTDSSCIWDNSTPAHFNYLLTRADISTGLYRGIKFMNQSNNNACTEFFLDTTDPNNPVLKVLLDSTDDADAVALTSADLHINNFAFSINGTYATVGSGVIGSSQYDIGQPRITMSFSIQVGEGSKVANRIIQTSISQRNLNVNN